MKANVVLSVPDWEQTPQAITASMDEAIAKANTALDQIGEQKPGKITFRSTIVGLENARAQTSIVANRAAFLSQVAGDPLVRAAAEKAVKAFRE